MKLHKLATSILLLSLAACTQNKEGATPAEQAADASPLATAVAKVGDEAIYPVDVEVALDRTFSQAEQLYANADISDNVLRSIISSKAMKQVMQQQLDADEIARIEAQVSAYRDEIFTKEYLRLNVTPEPVSQKMVEDYYAKNKALFGQKQVAKYEMLVSAKSDLSNAENESIIGLQDQLLASKAWKQQAKSNQLLDYRAGVANANTLDEGLLKQISLMSVDQVKGPVLSNGRVYFIRITQMIEIPARPLVEVSSSIRKTLSVMQLRKAVKAASEEVLAKVKVERF